MLTDSPYVAKRCQADIPIWDILVRGEDVGVLTDLPMEDSPMATVRYFGEEITFTANTIYAVLNLVSKYLASFDRIMEAQAIEEAVVSEAEYYSEVIGPMKAAEDHAEARGWGNEKPIW